MGQLNILTHGLDVMPKILALPFIVAALFSISLTACSSTSQKPVSESPETAKASNREGAIELDWEPPTDRVNGQRLSRAEISGYRLYVGDTSGEYNRTIDIKDPRKTNYVVRGLQPGKDYFVTITTIDRAGRESPKSEEVSLAAAPLSDTQLAESQQTEQPQRSRAQ